ncbi:hypothetical protein NliqN6_0607 [Naganishia liquefaciens]|uniref:Uncharacterized protein n=1 Tax=Naganishia liquefaciens TaxID=104408 RepID=A0A8H3YCD6_9TREE|nr:hypothetical protein NliqN6_0607 [Naganishia liquefaciens]
MNLSPGIGPQRPPFVVSTPCYRQVAPPHPSLRTYPVSDRGAMLMTMAAPRPNSRHPSWAQQPFSRGATNPPFMPSMPSMPYAIPMMLPMSPHTFPHPLMLQGPSRIQHVHHHHYHHLARDPQFPGKKRAFPSQEARERHEQKGLPQVYDPDGSLMDYGQRDDGPVVIDLEEAELTGKEMVVHGRYGLLEPELDSVNKSEAATDISESNTLGSRQHCHKSQPRSSATLPKLEEDAPVSESSEEGTDMIDCSPERAVSKTLTDRSSVLDKMNSDRNPALHASDVQHIATLSPHIEDAPEQLGQSAQSLRNHASTSLELYSTERRCIKSLQ